MQRLPWCEQTEMGESGYGFYSATQELREL